ncbi:MAG: ABC transporter permease, partial [Lachnospiraceae bacterium]|nr:ABC transporter permease [Lachnospiraceae bacterium]
GDLGTSYTTQSSVVSEIGSRVWVSVRFSLVATAIVTVVGVSLGVLCAVYQYSFFDNFVNILAKTLGSIPGFLLGVLLMRYLAQELGWFPIFGFSTPKHWVLPLITQCLPFTATTIRQSRSAMLDCIRQDYVKTSRSKGAKESKVIFVDTLRNALLPIITNVGTNFAIFIGGAVVVENVFSIPGIGSKVIEAINNADMPVVMACSMVIAIMFTGMALIIDLCYALVDPRLKSTFVKAKKKTKKVKREEQS